MIWLLLRLYPHLYWYCYANNHPELVKKRTREYSPEREFMIK